MMTYTIDPDPDGAIEGGSLLGYVGLIGRT